ADALRNAAMDLALDDQRVDQRAAVVYDAVPQHLDLGRLRVGLDDDRMHPGGERGPHRREELPPLDPRRVTLRDRRPAPLPPAAPPARTGGSPRAPPANWVAAWAASSNASRSGFDRPAAVPMAMPDSGSPLILTIPSAISMSSGEASSAAAATLIALALAARA